MLLLCLYLYVVCLLGLLNCLLLLCFALLSAVAAAAAAAVAVACAVHGWCSLLLVRCCFVVLCAGSRAYLLLVGNRLDNVTRPAACRASRLDNFDSRLANVILSRGLQNSIHLQVHIHKSVDV